MKLSKRGIILEQGNRIRGENTGWLIPWEYFEQNNFLRGDVMTLDLLDDDKGSYAESLSILGMTPRGLEIRVTRRKVFDRVEMPDDCYDSIRHIIDLTDYAMPVDIS